MQLSQDCFARSVYSCYRFTKCLEVGQLLRELAADHGGTLLGVHADPLVLDSVTKELRLLCNEPVF